MARPMKKSAVMLAILMVMLTFSNSAGATIVPDANETYIDSALIKAIEDDPSSTYPVIIQFSTEIESIHRAFMIKHGISFSYDTELLK